MTFMNPKHWGVLLCSFLVLGSASAQSVEYPFNPDSNGDNLIYTADILEVLAVYETEFDPEPITVDGITLEEYLIQLNEAIEAVEAGTAGADGADGADGQDGIGIASITDNGDGTLTIALTDGTAVITGDLTGPAGEAGADGEDGADGAPGFPGADGADGADGNDGADGVGISTIGLNGSGALGVQLTDGTLLNVGCILDADADGICDQVDACTDTEAANYNVGNAACEYNKWYIPLVLDFGPAILATSTPFGYREAHFDCVQSVVDADDICIDVAWDDICESAYLSCVNSPDLHLERLDYAVGDVGPAGGIIVYVDTFDVHVGFDYLEAANHDFVGATTFGMPTDLFNLECTPTVILLSGSNSVAAGMAVGTGEAQVDESGEESTFAAVAGGGGDASLAVGYRIRNAGGTAIGTGLINTQELAHYNTCEQSVARQVLSFQQNGYRDFHIPSLWELKVMAQAMYDLPSGEVILVGGVGGGGGGGAVAHSAMSGSYWSSSEFDATRGLGAFIMNFGGLVFMHGNAEFANDNKIRPVRAF